MENLIMQNSKIIICGNRASISADASAVSGCICIEAVPDRMSLVSSVIRNRPDAVIVHLDDIGEKELISALEFMDSMDRPAYIIIGTDVSHICEKFPYINCFALTPERERIEYCIQKSRISAPSGIFSAMTAAERDLELAVTEIIIRMGIPAHIKGYRYLRCGVLIALRDMSVLDSITKQLYPSIAKRFGTTASCVERAIRHAIASAWDKGVGDIAFIESKLRCKIDFSGEKPTNSELIALISDSMRLGECA